MRYSARLFSPIVFCALLTAATYAQAFGSFDAETRKLGTATGCAKGKLSPAIGDGGRLWGCIAGGSESVKIFVNEKPTGNVQNVKFMWNDWWRDTGHGVHPDADLARSWAAVIAATYAPTQVDKALKLFAGSKRGELIEGNYRLVYTYERGPAIDERLIVVTRR